MWNVLLKLQIGAVFCCGKTYKAKSMYVPFGTERTSSKCKNKELIQQLFILAIYCLSTSFPLQPTSLDRWMFSLFPSDLNDYSLSFQWMHRLTTCQYQVYDFYMSLIRKCQQLCCCASYQTGPKVFVHKSIRLGIRKLCALNDLFC